MKRFVRLVIAATLLSATSSAIHPDPAEAQFGGGAIVCSNCSTSLVQAVQLIKEAASLAEQIAMYQNMLQQYQNMLQNTINLPNMVWNNAINDIMRIRSLMSSAMMLGSNAQNFTAELSNVQGFVGQLQSLQQIQTQYQQWGTVTSNDITQLQTSLGVQETERASDTQILAQLQQHSQSAAGQMQAIQAGNEMAALGVSQMQKLQELMAQETQLVVDQTTVDKERQAASDSALESFLSSTLPLVSGNGHGYQ